MKKLVTCGLLVAVGLAAQAAVGLSSALPSPLLVAGLGRAYILGTNGVVTWEQKNCGNIHRVWMRGGDVYYSNGDLYKVSPPGHEARLVCRPVAREGGGLFGYVVLPDGGIVIAENGSESVVELAPGSTNEVVRFKVDVRDAKGTTPDAHNRLRMIRKTAAGTYLVCCSGAHVVREYDRSGKLVWEQPTPALAFDVLRRANGNTVISSLGQIEEYTPGHQVVWSFTCADAPDLKLANLCGLQELPEGDLVVGTYANGSPDQSRVTAFQVTRGKKIVWSYAAPDHNMMTAERLPPLR